ncbi:F-box Skp2 [Cordyceps militaris]|uniref:F-box Skp2 n=1 Tax=Cordyceps militaris TaxID=73501 RepID=A0A2H4SE47_CORMI|nr:F-box Skp2 [Cordyceps militaris]
MSIDNSRLTRLERLPTEIVHAVVGFLKPWDVKKLSYTSKRLRQACLPTIFRRVEFEFSLHGIGELKDLLKSDVRSHVRSFSYELTGLLKPAKEMHDEGDDADKIPSYMSVYETLYDICNEQRSIIDEGSDLILASVFCALPLLKEVELTFCEALQTGNRLLDDDMFIKKDYHQHHLQVAMSAIQTARQRGVAIHTISLWGLERPYLHTWEGPDFAAVSETLRRLMENIKTLRLRESDWALELLSEHALGLDEIDMCEATFVDADLRTFLQTNKSTIQSIGFHGFTAAVLDGGGKDRGWY